MTAFQLYFGWALGLFLMMIFLYGGLYVIGDEKVLQRSDDTQSSQDFGEERTSDALLLQSWQAEATKDQQIGT